MLLLFYIRTIPMKYHYVNYSSYTIYNSITKFSIYSYMEQTLGKYKKSIFHNENIILIVLYFPAKMPACNNIDTYK